jgi:soluble lytic murein transglycosylase-like protein
MGRFIYTVLSAAGLAGMSITGFAQAQDTPPAYPEFTFKRIGLPTTEAKRLTVQIDPAAQAKALRGAPKSDVDPSVTKAAVAAASPSQSAKGAGSSEWDWFWDQVSPKLAASGDINLRTALDLIETKHDVPQPRLQHLQSIANDHGATILQATVDTQISPALVLALISVESGGRSDAQSSAGATGLMQLIGATATRFGVTDRTDPKQNIKGGVAYLDWLVKHFNGDPIMALAGYNAGENAVTKNGGVPPYAETRAYVPKGLAAWRVARGLCLTPPELLSDGCVFVQNPA